MFNEEKEALEIQNSDIDLADAITLNYRLFQKLFDDFPLCLCIWDYQLDIIACNDPYVDLLKMNSKEDLVKHFFEMSPENQHDGHLSSTKLLDLITQTFKDGSCKSHWIHIDKDGNEIPTQLTLKRFEVGDMKTRDVVLMYAEDMNVQKVTIDELELENNVLYDEMVYRIILQHMPEITQNLWFCYDLKKRNIKYFAKEEGSSAKLKTSSNFPNGFIKDGYIYKNDILKFLEIVDNIHSGIVKKSDIRIVLGGEPIWHEVTYDIIRDKTGEISLVIGKLTGIQDNEKLKSKEKLDSLTNCYNRDALNTIIGDIIDSSSYEDKHAIWIIEIHDINGMNVKYGMQFTDLVLIDMSNQLMENLKDCVVGRFHGKFVVFKKNCGTSQDIEEKTKEIIKCFVNSYESGDDVFNTSCNIGAAVFPGQGKNVVDIYAAATTALEHSKVQGENSFLLYDDSLKDSLEVLNSDISYEKSITDSTKTVSNKICLDIFNMLHSNLIEKQDRIYMVIEHIANEFQVDRCFVLTKQEDKYIAENTYSIDLDRAKADDKTIEEVREIFKNANDQGVFICDDLSETTAVKCVAEVGSLIATKIITDGKLEHILLLEMFDKTRHWTDREVNTIAQISKILSVFM